jgi:hypothetical protein
MIKKSVALASLVAMCLAAAPAMAQKDKDDKPSHGRGGGPPDRGGPPGQADKGPPGQGRGGPGASPGGPQQGNVVVVDRDRNAVYSYYRTEYAAGNCPPGLAKKGNGCLPPGQAKKMWAIGQPLPGGIVYYPLPPALLGQLSPLPAGYQYVRVANDILLMAMGTRMIAAAIADLSSF